MKPCVVSVANHKGGVLKTTMTVNLAAALVLQFKKRVLLIDTDMQQNLTQSLVQPPEYEPGMFTLYEALVGEKSLDPLVTHTAIDGLDIIPSMEDLVGADLSLAGVVARESVLQACLDQTECLSSYDFVFIDNPPSASLLVINSLVASNYYLVPVSAEFLPMTGLSLFGNSIRKISKVAPKLLMLGVVVTAFSRNERICRSVDNTVRDKLGDLVFDTKIRVNTKAKAAPSVRKTIFEYEASEKGRGTEDYTALAAEFLERIQMADSPEEELVANG